MLAAMDHPTLIIIHWLFSWIALAIMVVRLIWRKVAKQAFNLGDYLTMAACVFVVARMGIIHMVLTWKTNNMPAAYRENHVFTPKEIHQREIGSKLSLTARVVYSSYLWLQKLVLLDLYRRLLVKLPHEHIKVYSFLAVFLVTWIACQVSTFIECKPIHLYWQVVPHPGSCVEAEAQLMTVGILNIVTDLMLILLPLPLVVAMQAAWRLKAQLYVLFLLGIFIIAITIVRLPITTLHKDSQLDRSTWASVELLVTAFVVNAPTMYGLWNSGRRAHATSNGEETGDTFGMATMGSMARKTKIEADNVHGFESSPVGRSMGHIEGILQTRETIVTEYRETDRKARGYANLADETDNASTSSQKSILRPFQPVAAADALVKRVEAAMAAQEANWRGEFEEEMKRVKNSYDERVKVLLEREKQLGHQRLENSLLEQALALKKEFTGEVRKRVEDERDGRLGKLNDLSAAVADLEKLTVGWNDVVDTNQRTQQLHVAVEAVRASLESGSAHPRPFVRELVALKEIAADDAVVNAAIASINPSAYQRGLSTSAQLVDRFRTVAGEVRKASLLPDDAGVASHASSWALSKVMFKKQGLATGDDVESILTRTQTYLEEGDLDAAAREMNGLQGWAKTLSKDWLGEVRKVLEVQQALDVISTEARLQSLRVE
ncbi:hypothetical protein BN1723_006422 [Verticillium longisporum]|uniref:MICOS complex subunit MIC60 n=1 Tax=Verticillium longisporum TaxID=100787 RepID=A0A0G4NEX4_VERLO|nr:hypothetical protein BN1723_006422 [Verticillium longisporum]